MHRLLLRSAVRAHAALLTASSAPAPAPAPVHTVAPSSGTTPDGGTDLASSLARRDRGQATTEYALVLLGAAAVALLVVTWATAGGGAGRIGRLFDRVIDAVLGRV